MADQTANENRPDATSVPGLTDELYFALRDLARYHLRAQRGDITLNCTSLVHEAYLKILASKATLPNTTRNYAALASLAMRQILVDYIRQKRSEKHGGEIRRVTLHDPKGDDATDDHDLLDIDRAMRVLGEKEPYLEELVALRFFAGFSNAETAEALDRSTRSVERDWARARTYLFRELDDRHVD